LPNGKVLIVGGGLGRDTLASAEIYAPASGTFTATGSMGTPRCRHTSILLPSGKVLIAGGYDESTDSVASAELYDPASETFTATGSTATTRRLATATLLRNGKVLIVGGFGQPAVAELYY
jgi:type II secretory pathway component GspD/PulD (secretin)